MCPSGDSGRLAPVRPPTAAEVRLLRRLALADFQANDAIRQQLGNVMVSPIDSNGSLRLIVLTGPTANVLRRIPVEGEYDDEDGVTVHILLHVVEGRLNELEVFREDSGVIRRAADSVNDVRVIVL